MTPEALTLPFDLPPEGPRTRRTDPETSRKAARELPLRARQREVIDALRWLVVSSTADDVKRCLASAGFDRERNECASRLSELAALGMVGKVGVRVNHKGKSVATWALTEQGRTA